MAKKKDTKGSVGELIKGLQSSDAGVRSAAWEGAGAVGAAGVEPLADVMTAEDMEVARAAKRALWKIVRHAGRPKATREKNAVAEKLAALLAGNVAVSVRREVLWMLSEIGAKQAIDPMAELLLHKELREDARQALERIPIKQSLSALKDGFDKAPEDFKPNLAQSLRKRGAKVKGYPCRKLVPAKATAVKALGQK